MISGYIFSQTGKRLMARCQMLLQENEELGKTIASGRTAKLEGEIALQKTLVTEMKNNQSGTKQLYSPSSKILQVVGTLMEKMWLKLYNDPIVSGISQCQFWLS